MVKVCSYYSGNEQSNAVTAITSRHVIEINKLALNPVKSFRVTAPPSGRDKVNEGVLPNVLLLN